MQSGKLVATMCGSKPFSFFSIKSRWNYFCTKKRKECNMHVPLRKGCCMKKLLLKLALMYSCTSTVVLYKN
jgi:hypothetical protein